MAKYLFSCSKNTKVRMVCGPRRKKYGVKPFHSAVTPSFFTIFFTQSKAPEYSLFLRLTLKFHAHFIICRRVFTISTGSDTTVQKKPEVSEEAMCRPRPSCLNRCHLSKYSSFACE